MPILIRATPPKTPANMPAAVPLPLLDEDEVRGKEETVDVTAVSGFVADADVDVEEDSEVVIPDVFVADALAMLFHPLIATAATPIAVEKVVVTSLLFLSTYEKTCPAGICEPQFASRP